MIESEFESSWENDEVIVNVPFSVAGIGTTILITSKFTGKLMLLDVGDGALRDCIVTTQNSNFVNEIDMIAITHGHFDHVGGLHSLLGFMRMLNRTLALSILIPKNCQEAIGIIKGFREYYRDTLPFEIWYHELSDQSEFDTDFFKIEAIEVEHFGLESTPDAETLMPSLGYRVRVGETVIAYTGDTRPCKGAESVVRNADLAIIEATRKEAPSGPRVHLTINEAQSLAKLAKDHLLIHRLSQLPKPSG